MSKSEICLIYTGGTIGMQRIKGVLIPPNNPEAFLKIAPELEGQFDFRPLMNKDSTNINPADWKIIANEIYERRNAGYKGFIVAHGTDTMHFTASAVAFALGKNLNFPVVFTGAQTIPDVLHGDARVNLLRAFKVATTTDIAEVVISFGEYVFRGCRTQKRDERLFNAYESPSFFPLAYITEDILSRGLHKTRTEVPENIEFINDFAPGILQVSLIPGLEPNLLSSLLDNENCRGIVLQSFGAGNVPNESRFSWTDFIKDATYKGKPVLITSQFPANATTHTDYEAGIAARKAGAIPTGNMTSACATVKFRWVLAQIDGVKFDNGEDKINRINEMMNTVFIGEMDSERKS